MKDEQRSSKECTANVVNVKKKHLALEYISGGGRI